MLTMYNLFLLNENPKSNHKKGKLLIGRYTENFHIIEFYSETTNLLRGYIDNRIEENMYNNYNNRSAVCPKLLVYTVYRERSRIPKRRPGQNENVQ